MNYDMNLRKDLSDINNQALFVYLVMMSKQNSNAINNIMLELRSRNFNTDNSSDYTSAIKEILDAKNKAILDINSASNIAISKTTEITQISIEAKQIATESKLIAEEAKQIATESKQIATESKQIATESKQIAEEAKQLANIIDSRQDYQYAYLLERINQVYNLANDTKDLAIETKQIVSDIGLLVDTLSNNQDTQHDDLLLRIDYLYMAFYRSTSTIILQEYGNYTL